MVTVIHGCRSSRIREPRRGAGFTLVELLAVMAIMVILLGLIVPATTTIFKGSLLTQSADMLTNQLALARQQALTTNSVVEVRIYQYAHDGAPSRYCALQAFKVLSSGTYVPLDKVQVLLSAIMIDSGNADTSKTLSSIISLASSSSTPTSASGTALNVSIPGAQMAYNAVKFQFLPDGSTNLPQTGQPWFLTLHSMNDGDGLNSPPKNFCVIQVDPYNGNVRAFRP